MKWKRDISMTYLEDISTGFGSNKGKSNSEADIEKQQTIVYL